MSEPVMTITKGILIIASWMWFQVSDMTGGLINEAFDKMFSLGLLIVVLIILFKEYRKSQEYNRERDARIEQLLINSNEAISGFKQALKSLENTIKSQ